jgi:tripartite-type tricarboxylate transporter receptor subunit TctC
MLRPGLLALPLCAIALECGAASGNRYPAKPLRIVTSEAGGGNDVQARLLAQGLTRALGEQVVVENRPSGVIPGDVVAKAAPDGYTLLFYNNALWTAPLLQPAPYVTARDFAPITTVATAPNVLVVNATLPANSVAELVALARTKPGALNYGSAGNGASNHLAAELFKAMARIDIIRVNYKGAGPALTALLAGELQLMFPTAGAVMPHIRADRLKALAVTSLEPTALFPGLPTVAAVLSGYESMSLYGMFAPAGTSPAIVTRVNAELMRFLGEPDIREKFFNAGLEVAGSSPEQLAAAIKSEISRLSTLINDVGIRQ